MNDNIENPLSEETEISEPATTETVETETVETETVETETVETETEKTVSSSPTDTESQLTLKEFNEVQTTTGTIKLNEEIYKEIKITNFYLNLILTSVVVCCCVYFIAKGLKKLFYVNIF